MTRSLRLRLGWLFMLQSTRQLRETKGQKQNLVSGNKDKRVYHFRFSQAKTMTAT
jgi:hypothetical protein